MGITTGFAGHQAGKGLVAFIEKRLVVGRLLVVDQLVGLLEGFQLFPDVGLIHAAEHLFAKFHGGQGVRDVLHGAHRRLLLPAAADAAGHDAADQRQTGHAGRRDHQHIRRGVVGFQAGGGDGIAVVGKLYGIILANFWHGL